MGYISLFVIMYILLSIHAVTRSTTKQFYYFLPLLPSVILAPQIILLSFDEKVSLYGIDLLLFMSHCTVIGE